MLRPDIQAELLLSFQEERRQKAQRAQREAGELPSAPPYRSRFLLAAGTFMIGFGRSLHRSAGKPIGASIKTAH